MNILKKLILISSLALSATVFAHSDGHGKVNTEKAIEIAQTSAKMLVFKDHGMSVGKIEPSWNDVTKAQFSLVEEGESSFIVKAINTKTKQILYFNINKKGEVNDVKDGRSFNRGHSH
jgi:hypothetical protein